LQHHTDSLRLQPDSWLCLIVEGSVEDVGIQVQALRHASGLSFRIHHSSFRNPDSPFRRFAIRSSEHSAFIIPHSTFTQIPHLTEGFVERLDHVVNHGVGESGIGDVGSKRTFF